MKIKKTFLIFWIFSNSLSFSALAQQNYTIPALQPSNPVSNFSDQNKKVFNFTGEKLKRIKAGETDQDFVVKSYQVVIKNTVSVRAPKDVNNINNMAPRYPAKTPFKEKSRKKIEPQKKTELQKKTEEIPPANGAYVGFDAGYGEVKAKFLPNSDTDGNGGPSYPGIKSSVQGGSERLFTEYNAGYKLNFYNFLIAPEIFYDDLNYEIKDPFNYINVVTGYENDNFQLKHRIGARLNLGYQITPKFSLYGNAGYAYTKYKITSYSWNSFPKHYEDSPIFGLGIIYDLNKNWALKLSYNYQNLNISIPKTTAMEIAVPSMSWKYNLRMHEERLGILYRF